MAAQSDNPKITITLTGRRPVTVAKSEWPILAEASDFDHDGQVECQSNVRERWRITVRSHEDGRAIVYGVYRYETNFMNARDYDVRGGELVEADDIEAAIQRVGAWMRDHSEHENGDAARFDAITRECLANLPAEEL